MKVAPGKPSRCTSIRKVTAALILSFITLSAPVIADNVGRNDAQNVLEIPSVGDSQVHGYIEPHSHRFTLRHIYHHGTDVYPNLHRKMDVRPDAVPSILLDDGHQEPVRELIARSRMINIHRLRDRRPLTVEPMLAAARALGYPPASPPSAWVIDSVQGPNITDKKTVVNLAEIAANSYATNESSTDWKDITGGFNRTASFGWEGDGLRGHIFASETNSTVIIGIKGTTPAVFDGTGTTTNDKLNDNLFASCCCAQQGVRTWLQVCECATSAFTCNRTCVVQALRNESRYYTAARNIYTNVSLDYPNSDIWMVGHSLGGAVSGLLGLTYGLPAITFEAFPEALAAARLGLPQPPESVPGMHQSRSMTGSYHFGHTADPIYMGACNGGFSFCSMAGYAFESQCHTGQRCVYDVVGDKGWRLSMRTHGIRTVIDTVIKVYDEVPECAAEPECQDCYNWNFYDSNSSIPSTSSTTTSSTTKTRTRTSTCKTPGWWGCLDESTSTAITSTTSSTKLITTTTTTTTTTSTCKTPGWFGRCLDETTTTTTSSSSAQAATVTQTSPFTQRSSTATVGYPPMTSPPKHPPPKPLEI